ncbi:SRPBCC family protein [Bacillus sp. EB600]|nr:SRPBCC family protein [Bacillus sp. EB600]
MPSGMHQEIIDLPIEMIWSFVKDMDHWAPLIPGYISHKKFNNRQSTWEFYQDLGIIKKKISLMVTIREWIPPTKVTFDLKGLNEKFSGNGYFQAEALDKNKTKITGYLEILAEGAMGKVVNKILKTSIPKTAQEMTTAIAEKFK